MNTDHVKDVDGYDIKINLIDYIGESWTTVNLMDDVNSENPLTNLEDKTRDGTHLQNSLSADNIENEPTFEDNIKPPTTCIIRNSNLDIDISMQCSNCDEIFTVSEFDNHICLYDDNKMLIKLEKKESSSVDEEQASVSSPKPLFVDHPSLKLMQTNNETIAKWLKYSYKLDLSIKDGGDAANKNQLKKSDGPHQCTVCDRKFVHASGLARHLDKHQQDMLPTNNAVKEELEPLSVGIQCLKCFRLFSTVILAMKHLEREHTNCPESILMHDMSEDECNEDGSKAVPNQIEDILVKKGTSESLEPFINQDLLKPYILTAILQCEFCEFVFGNTDALLMHEAAHDPTRGYECSNCEIFILTAKGIASHWSFECQIQATERLCLQKYFVCNVCEHKFVTRELLYEHRYQTFHLFPRQDHSGERFLVGCEVCGIICNTAKGMIDHHQDNHVRRGRKNYTNSRNDGNSNQNSFDSKSTKYRQYLCDVCGKSYTQSSHLWQHLRFHRGVKPFACNEPNCTRRFTIRPDLNDHIRKCHTGERPYHCLICGKRFLTGSVFYQHRLIHRGERRYGCDECGKRFYRADALKNHQRIHTGEKPYACEQCLKKFRQRGDRDKHVRARHQNHLTAAVKKGKYLAKHKLLNPQTNPLSIKNNDVVFVGSVPFPISMFRPMLTDIDANIK